MADVTAGTSAFSDRYHFLIRRLHSLSGIIPVGVFLCIHMSVNASIIAGPRAFQFAVDRIHQLNELGILKVVEVVFIFIPIAFHAIVGLLIWLTSKPNVFAYRFCGNIRYTLQRWTAIVTVIFIFFHLWHVHWIIPGGTTFDPHAAAASALHAMAAWWTGPVYAIGVTCAVFHLANGIWTFLIVWGITIGPKSQVRSGWVCGLIGVALAVLGLGALVRLKTMDASALNEPAGTTSHAAAGLDTGELYA
ncbi:MAG: succinate dehydrogenase [Planctomycetes bacterium]|nr:succinate dehydrogenase [Planctomycetota bacterium]